LHVDDSRLKRRNWFETSDEASIMKVAVFFDRYLPYHEFKDPGLIPLGLNRLGCDTCLVTLAKPQLMSHESPFPLVRAQEDQLHEVGFWKRLDAEIVMCYTWFLPIYDSILEKIAAAGKKIVIKADTDGRLGYPVTPRYVSDPATEVQTRLPWLRRPGMFGALRVMGSSRYRTIMSQKLRRIEVASAVIVESPEAKENIERFLKFWGEPDQRSKLHFVPNAVAEDVLDTNPTAKSDIMISIGNWVDPRKNVHTMLICAKRFLEDNPSWKLRILGEGEQPITGAVSQWCEGVASRIELRGQVDHGQVLKLQGDSRIFFAPSSSESWGMAAAEAACMGCTIVGTPLESFEYLAADGFSGTLSDGFESGEIMKALKIDVAKHSEGAYNPVEIARYWRSALSVNQVSVEIQRVVSNL
jgi:glycosyltransferase involved in cell wall biosynthesis